MLAVSPLPKSHVDDLAEVTFGSTTGQLDASGGYVNIDWSQATITPKPADANKTGNTLFILMFDYGF